MIPPRHTLRRVRMLAGMAALTLISAGIAVLGSAQPAAAVSFTTIHRSSWAYIDSRDPKLSHLDPSGDAPVGALRDADGKHHNYRSFFTFDVSRFLGRQVSQVTLYTRETQAQDCVDRQVELWSTGPVDASTTWDDPPAENQKLYTAGYLAGSACPATYVEWDATAAVQQAVAAGSAVLTLELRVPEADEGDTTLGRQFSNDLGMTVWYNTPPDVPTKLGVDSLGCATGQPYPWETGGTPWLHAYAADPDQGQPISVEFAVWPVDHPDQRTTPPATSGTSGLQFGVYLERGSVVDATAYAFAARTIDQDGVSSAWSQPCYFQTDFTRPANPPLVSSADYPADGVHGGAGIPGSFTFSANGVPDVVGFVYGWNGGFSVGGTNFVPADQPGGSGAANLAPPGGGPNSLTVMSVDRAGNRSNITDYFFFTRNTAPVISLTTEPKLGRPFPVSFAPGDLPPGYDSVVSYTYTVNDGTPRTVPANADGTATVDLSDSLSSQYSSILDVHSTSSNGWVSPAGESWYYPDNSPSVWSDIYPEWGTGGGVGQAGTFTFGSNFAGSTKFYYSFDSGGTWQTVPVGPDGTASVTWTPETAGDVGLYIYSQTADGTQSDWYLFGFYVGE